MSKNINKIDYDLLINAVNDNDYSKAKKLIKSVDIDSAEIDQNINLVLGLISDHSDLISSALGLGADLNKAIKLAIQKNISIGEPALTLALEESINIDIDLLNQLIEKNEINMRLVYKLAAFNENRELMQICLEKRYHPTEVFKWAIKNQDSQLIKEAIDKGADVPAALKSTITKGGEKTYAHSLFEMDKGQDDNELLHIALDKGADPTNVLTLAIKNNYLPLIISAIQKGGHLDGIIEECINNNANPSIALKRAIENKDQFSTEEAIALLKLAGLESRREYSDTHFLHMVLDKLRNINDPDVLKLDLNVNNLIKNLKTIECQLKKIFAITNVDQGITNEGAECINALFAGINKMRETGEQNKFLSLPTNLAVLLKNINLTLFKNIYKADELSRFKNIFRDKKNLDKIFSTFNQEEEFKVLYKKFLLPLGVKFYAKYQSNDGEKFIITSCKRQNEYPISAYKDIKGDAKTYYQDGKIYLSKTKEITPDQKSVRYVLSKNGNLYIDINGCNIEAHSYFLKGKESDFSINSEFDQPMQFWYARPVASAGFCSIKEGKITAIDGASGHYTPIREQVLGAAKYLNDKGVLDSSCKIMHFDNHNIPFNEVKEFDVEALGDFILVNY